ncbi:hypothetical protein [Actinokineospora sp.]|uniref:hypothetical protein n=1 Tax=Actinokineospora sp. TaxID=1872133 RepID=UPI00403844B4
MTSGRVFGRLIDAIRRDDRLTVMVEEKLRMAEANAVLYLTNMEPEVAVEVLDLVEDVAKNETKIYSNNESAWDRQYGKELGELLRLIAERRPGDCR